jgi:DNA polymerase V
MLTGLVLLSQVQTDLFDDQDRGRSKRLMSVLDAINDRWGDGTLRYAASGMTRAWRTQFHRRSPAYTTHWPDLPLVQAK